MKFNTTKAVDFINSSCEMTIIKKYTITIITVIIIVIVN